MADIDAATTTQEVDVEVVVDGESKGEGEINVTTGGVIVDVNSAPLARPAFSTEEQIKRAKKIYSGEAVTQVVTIFQKYDVNQNGVIELSELPRMCSDFGIKPWQALKELSTNENGEIELREFISWWFSSSSEHTRQEETYVHSIFDQYDADKDGFINQSELVRLCVDLNVKPWKAFKELDVDAAGQVNKKQFSRWWFSAQNSSESAAPPVRKQSTPRKSPNKSARKAPVSRTSKEERIAAAMAEVKRAMANLEAALESSD